MPDSRDLPPFPQIPEAPFDPMTDEAREFSAWHIGFRAGIEYASAQDAWRDAVRVARSD